MLLASRWHEFTHLGDVPTVEERAALQNSAQEGASSVDVGKVPVYSSMRYFHAPDDPGDQPTFVAAPTLPPAPTAKSVGVDSFLVDSGTPLDIVNKPSIGEHVDKI